jgi:hypothetical protein
MTRLICSIAVVAMATGLCFSSPVTAQEAKETVAAATPAKPIDFPGLGPKGTLSTIEFEAAGEQVLRGPNARMQLIVNGRYSSGQIHDLTRDVKYSAAPDGVLQVSAGGLVAPVGNGEVQLTATGPDGKSATAKFVVDKFDTPQPINFANEITPIFTKLGCNAGGCHGKSGGQNNFKLSLLGFYPNEDYEYLVKEHRGRRILPAAPEYSLVLLKGANKMPHAGGRRIDEGSFEWQMLTRWIEQGMPYGAEDDPTVERIDVLPKQRRMNRHTWQQISVIARYSDGSSRDVTQMSTFESNDTQMAESTPAGVVNVFNFPGEVAIMVRFQGQVDVFRASIPLGVEVKNLPPQKNVVDQHVFNKLKDLGIPPSELCSDSAFIRRAFIDVAGRLPTADQARAFVDDKDPNKRDKLVDYLLEHPGYGDYFANKWALVLRNRRVQNTLGQSFKFHDWIRRAIQRNMPYDEFVRDILAATGEVKDHPPVAWFSEVNTATEQMEDTAQLFLGLRIQCARCHHHPFEQWSQNDYYGFQAFYSRVGRKSGIKGGQNARVYHNPGTAQARNPRTGKDLKPTGLGGQPFEIESYDDPRHLLVDWMADPKNPFFARALVNRYWKHFFGRGIVDPEDDMRATNPPSNPELLDALAKSFIDSGFDIKKLVRTICTSSTYQLSSEPNEYNLIDKQNFSSFYPRRMNAEPLYDAINQVAGTNVNFAGLPVGTRAVQLPDNGFADYFLTVFGKPQAESACECERISEANLAQTLHLLNSTDIQGKLAAGNGRAAKLGNDEERPDQEKVTELYFWALARPPRQKELDLILPYIEERTNKRQAYEDVMWALFNTKEFLFNM